MRWRGECGLACVLLVLLGCSGGKAPQGTELVKAAKLSAPPQESNLLVVELTPKAEARLRMRVSCEV